MAGIHEVSPLSSIMCKPRLKRLWEVPLLRKIATDLRVVGAEDTGFSVNHFTVVFLAHLYNLHEPLRKRAR